MFLSSCCPKLACIWQQMVRGKVYLTQIINRRNHPAVKYQQSSSREDNSLLMDISELEEQYDSIRQKQKEQTHVVFRTDISSTTLHRISVKENGFDNCLRHSVGHDNTGQYVTIALYVCNGHGTQTATAAWKNKESNS
ncbi:uncharacterized protein LOC125460527 isoform X2 [Stegostoma tigrinum]|uniref:uncharacterized protein LOC125460527 isoform X2 n=1 Tax=Stegostoma tigrinum TaxID=3053191 RepID=UPI00202B9D37|nr:uncharacterized protein LOC125460527 isoform X2 [Stegostoma tigrinum]